MIIFCIDEIMYLFKILQFVETSVKMVLRGQHHHMQSHPLYICVHTLFVQVCICVRECTEKEGKPHCLTASSELNRCVNRDRRAKSHQITPINRNQMASHTQPLYTYELCKNSKVTCLDVFFPPYQRREDELLDCDYQGNILKHCGSFMLQKSMWTHTVE